MKHLENKFFNLNLIFYTVALYGMFLLQTNQLKAEAQKKLSLIVIVEKTQDLSENDRNSLRTEVEKTARNLGNFSILSNDALGEIFNEKALMQTGLTAATETKLLKVADAFIFSRVRADIDRGAVLELTLVMQDREKYVGTDLYSRSNSSKGVKNALRQILSQLNNETIADNNENNVTAKKSKTPGKREKTYAAKSKKGALLRSMIVPGWGQMYSDHYYSGAGFLTGTLLLAAGYQSSKSAWLAGNNDYDSLLVLYLLPASSNDQIIGLYMLSSGSAASSKIKSSSNQALVTSSLLAALYIGNLVEAYINGPGSGFGMLRYNFGIAPDFSAVSHGGETGVSMIFGTTIRF